MNRWYLVVAAGAALSLVACGKSAPEQVPSPTASGTSASQAAVPAGETATTLAATALAATQPVTHSCYLDKVDGEHVDKTFEVASGQSVTLVGWAVNAAKAAPADATVVLKGDSIYGLRAHVGGTRPDVARALKSKAATRSGFQTTSTLAGVDDGSYALMVLMDSSAQPVLCDLGRTVSVH